MFSFLSLVEIGSVFVSSHYHIQQWRKIRVWLISLCFNGFIIEIFFFCCKLFYVLYERCLIPFYQANERHMRTLAVEPPPLLDKEERRVKFINRNGLCCTLYKVDTYNIHVYLSISGSRSSGHGVVDLQLQFLQFQSQRLGYWYIIYVIV